MIGQEELSSISRAFGMGQVIQLKELAGGYANQNFKLVTSRGTYCLRICLQQPLELLKYEEKLMEQLKVNGFPTAFPIPLIHGGFIFLQGDQRIMVYEFREGITPLASAQTAFEMGQAVGRLSCIAPDDYLTKKKNTLDLSHMRMLIDHFPKATNPIPEIFEFVKTYYEKFYLLEAVHLPTGIIHGDIFPNNTIFDTQEQLVAVIDFEEACVDRLLLDIAMTMNGFCFIDNKLSKELADAFLRGYQKHRQLTEIEEMLLLKFIMLAAFSMIGWHMRFHLADVPNDNQEQRVRELMERIRYLDKEYNLHEKKLAALN